MAAHGDFDAPKPSASIFYGRKCLGQDFIQPAGQLFVILDLGKLLFPGSGFLAQLFIGSLLQFSFEGVDLRHQRAQALDFALIFGADKLFYNITNHGQLETVPDATETVVRRQRLKNNTSNPAKLKSGKAKSGKVLRSRV